MLRKVLMVIAAFFLFLLQSCVFPHVSLGGIVPNLILLITSIFGFMHGEKAGMITGFCLGLLFDVFYGDYIGLHALILTYIGFMNGKFFGIFYPEDIKLPIGLTLTSNFSYGILCYILSFLIRGRLNIGYYLLHVILPEMLYTLLATIIIYPIILIIYKAFENMENKKKKEA
ncbi:MAG: rod shape-determining protein MreD [Lachnospiraceae bacterium]|nr:rod shape-determining protein MreD [Lachnospiraceae bacterium]